MEHVPKGIESIRRLVLETAGSLDALIAISGTKEIPRRERSGFIGTPGHRWTPLDRAGHLAQSRAKREFDRFVEVATVILATAVASKRKDFDKGVLAVRHLIEQEPQHAIDFQRLTERGWGGLHRSLGALESLAEDATTLLVIPDTSAVLDAPNLEAFDFGEDDVEVVITPVLLRELNDIKDDGRKDRDVRARARAVIRQLRDYRARGNIIRGVDGYQGVRIRALAAEPLMEDSLPWLDREVNDDRLIASVLEVMRQNLGSRVVLVTSDVNHQNKADAAGIVCVDPPSDTP